MFVRRALLLILWLIGSTSGAANLSSAQAPMDRERPRLLVLTDIGGDPDDMQSMRRLMLYANEVELVGLIATAAGIRNELAEAVTRPDLIEEIVSDYEEVRPTLSLHAPGYPSAEALRGVIRSGSLERGVEHLRAGRSSDGSRHIIASVDADARPLYVAIWGGAHDLAQALLDVRDSRSDAQLATFLSRLRVYAIGDQDAPRIAGVEAPGVGTGQWIRDNFPSLRYVQANPPGEPSFSALFRGMYQNDSRAEDGTITQLVADDVVPLTQERWVEENVRNGRGALGAGYPVVTQNPTSQRNTRGVKEGDTPSFFFMLPNGLSNPEYPSWGGWGGRFRQEGENHYFDAEDEHWSGSADPGVRAKWTVARWREAYQNEFAARMSWAILPFSEANHNPKAVLNGDGTRDILFLSASPGERVTLEAAGSEDPDGDHLSYRWSVYEEASSYVGSVALHHPDAIRAELLIPADAAGREIHVILEVTDDGRPPLTSYRRAIVRVMAHGR